MQGIFNAIHTDSIGYAMDTASAKNGVIAENIANVDTPGYKAGKLEFGEAMAEYMGEGKKLPLSRTDDMHLPPKDEIMDPSSFIRKQNNPSLRNDGNDVNLDYEMSELAQNTVRYQELSLLSSHGFTKMKSAIQGR
ncbi:flagellar basal body rod protein FlgB [Limisalsivibrio acetivorans]|uniref:flagellar basal body rod protein FlgB n=1 Tax=Limisalsivibrio acetivorans TaxID=1304888 RepID=UPI0003B77503|nr:flagellar basal body rod protein FlgB [Limisalsivibrio acetivorans]